MPTALSSAWPNVWPRLRWARSPASRKSAPTTAALTAIAGGDDRGNRRRISRNDRIRVVLEGVEQRCVGEKGVLEHLGETAHALTFGERSCQGWVNTHLRGGREGPDEILPSSEIDPRLAANCRVDHRKNRRGDEYGVDPAEEERSREGGGIGDSASAKGDQRPGSVE